MITLDTETNTVDLETEDFKLLGERFVLKIRALSSDYGEIEVDSFLLMITLTTTGPEFIEPPTGD